MAVPVDYHFVLDTIRLVGITHELGTDVGRLNVDGEFRFIHRYGPDGGSQWHLYDTINTLYFTPQPVYEFRSGRLIPGTADIRGVFTPDLGGKVIPFSDYRYDPMAPRIWNLPGYFRVIIPLRPCDEPEAAIRGTLAVVAKPFMRRGSWQLTGSTIYDPSGALR